MTELAAGDLLYERRGAQGEIGWLTFNRPERRNAITFAMYDALRQLAQEAGQDRSLRVLVLSGAGGKAFAAGTEMSQFHEFKTAADALAYEERIESVLTAVESIPLPTVAAIQGACTGGGAALALACDLRLGSPSTRLGVPIARTLGNTLSMGNFVRLVSILGVARTKHLLLTAQLLDAQQCLQAGLLSEVTADEAALLPRAEELAATLAGHAPITMRTTKLALRRIAAQLMPAEGGSDLVVEAYLSADFKEGLEAFFAKRPARWQGV
ncbi:MAG: enoyl-CoA hydratase [Candidatus Dormibacteraeota bacterium]|nr:enoyl-CoA hydratase [Candidatus Dormibacteraeota bacterium]